MLLAAPCCSLLLLLLPGCRSITCGRTQCACYQSCAAQSQPRPWSRRSWVCLPVPAGFGTALWLGAATCVPHCCCYLLRRCSWCAAGVHSGLRCWWHLRRMDQEQQAQEQPRAPLLHPLQQQLGMPVHQPVLVGAAGTAVSAVLSLVLTLLLHGCSMHAQLSRLLLTVCQAFR
jgi:hypothetical protein